MICAAPQRPDSNFSRSRFQRGGFSLLEVILATAVLAGSGAALFALIGQASKLAVRAEQRSEALQIAESVLDEFIAMGGRQQSEMNGVYEANPAWAYRLQVDSPLANGVGAANNISSQTDGGGSSGNANNGAAISGESPTADSPTDTSISGRPTRLVRIAVLVFPAGAGDGAASGQLGVDANEQRGAVQLVGWARLPAGGAGSGP
ncbi:type IV pilus modification PilV family protein [Planctomycetaceae bacterium SH139]